MLLSTEVSGPSHLNYPLPDAHTTPGEQAPLTLQTRPPSWPPSSPASSRAISPSLMEIKHAYEETVGHRVRRAMILHLLHRHGWSDTIQKVKDMNRSDTTRTSERIPDKYPDAPTHGPCLNLNQTSITHPPSRTSVTSRTSPTSQTVVNTYYIWSFDGKLLAEYDQTGTCLKDYIYFGDRLLAEYHPQTGKYYYYMSDQVNTTRLMTDDTGNHCLLRPPRPLRRPPDSLDRHPHPQPPTLEPDLAPVAAARLE